MASYLTTPACGARNSRCSSNEHLPALHVVPLAYENLAHDSRVRRLNDLHVGLWHQPTFCHRHDVQLATITHTSKIANSTATTYPTVRGASSGSRIAISNSAERMRGASDVSCGGDDARLAGRAEVAVTTAPPVRADL